MDESTFRRTLNRHFGAELKAVDSAEEAVALLRQEKFDLVLVNRVFDRDGDEGLALIQRLKGEPELATAPVMLISNYPDFQSQAERMGAVPGVGKSTLSTKESIDRLGAFLGQESAG
jgi:response regulator RpfG family c-di-GMP phosphodiesterase